MYDAVNIAKQYLAKQERTESALYQHLLDKGFEAEVAKNVLESAKENGWVCDERYALRYCEQRLCKGDGPLKITADLKAKGIAVSAIVKAVAGVELSTWEHAAKLALEKKFGRQYRTENRTKVISFLELKGFNDEHMMFLVRED